MARSLLLLASRESRRLLSAALQRVESLVPTDRRHEHYAEGLCKLLVTWTEPKDTAAVASAGAVLDYMHRFPMPKRLWHQDHEYATRTRFLLWLHKLPVGVLRQNLERLKRCARSVAANDAWEVQAFASLAGKTGDYDLESELLESTIQSIESERMWEETTSELRILALAARANRAKQTGDWDQARTMLDGIHRDGE